MARTRPQNPDIQTDWFKEKMAERKLSIRALAKLIDVDPATMSLMLRGIRGMTNTDAVRIGTIFNVPPNEVLRRAGAPLPDECKAVPVSMYVDSTPALHDVEKSVQDSFPAPYDVPNKAEAIQFRTRDFRDGWHFVTNGEKLPPEDCVGNLCLYCLPDGTRRIGVLRKGYKAGTFNVDHPQEYTFQPADNAHILWASPVLWIKPSAE